MLEACWEKAGAFVHQQIIWVKDRGVLTRSHYLWKHEPCFMGWRRPNRPPKVAEETLASTWALPSFAKDDRPDHPTPKPLDAFGIPMRQHVARGGLCYEPFCGSGSQIMAGEANGRRVFAMEISPAYVDVAVERWQAETGRDAILDGDGRTFAQVKSRAAGRRRHRAHGNVRQRRHRRTRPQTQIRSLRPCMTWLYIPPDALPEPETHACSASPSAPARAGSTSGSPSPSPDIVLWVTSSGKPSPQPLSWRGWKTRPWIRLLSGTTLEPSTAARGAARGRLTAGYPCQPFSVAGKRRGADDPRHLWPHVARIIGEVEPPFVFLENVAHHLRLGFPEVASGLVGMGYRLAAGLFTAAEVGAPHKRERLFILAIREGDELADPARLLRDPVEWREPDRDAAAVADRHGDGQQGRAEPDQRTDGPPEPASRRGDALRCDPSLADAADRQLPQPGRRAEATRRVWTGMARDWPTPMANDGCKPSAGNRRTADLTHAAACG